MKVAVTGTDESLDSRVDPRFGRARAFLIFDRDTGRHEFVVNEQNLNAPQGAGIQAAQLVAEKDVGAVITGNCGPKAFRTLSAAGIEVYTAGDSTVREALDKLARGELPKADKANVEGHW